MNKRIADHIALFIITICIIVFFSPLFYPELKIYVTPDQFLSDILHFNYPLKNFLSESLKQNRLPLWTDLIGMGFPVLAEAEIGAFSLVNLILFRFFPTPIAFNLGYVITFLFFGWGMYAAMRELHVFPIVAFFCSILFTFTGFHIVQIPHYNHLQVFSLFPWIFYCTIKMMRKPNSRIWLLLPFLFSQQVFFGHYQYVFMTVIFIFLFIYLIGFRNEEIAKQYRSIFLKRWLIVILLSIGLSAVQLLPSFEFFLLSQRNMFIKL